MSSITEQQENSNYLSSLQKEWSEIIYAHYRTTHPQDRLVQIESKINFSRIASKCAGYHKRESGHGITHPVLKLCRTLFLKYWYDLSLRETEQSINGSIVGKLFCGYALNEWCADHTLIGRFEAWVEENVERGFFDEILSQIDEQYGQEKSKVQKGDTFGVEANAAKESLVRLIRHSGQKLLHAWSEEQKVTYEEVLTQIGRDTILGPEDEKNYFRLTAEERSKQLRESVKGALASYDLSEKGQSKEVIKWREQIKKICDDEVNITYDDNGNIVEVKKKSKKERGSYRIGSATDPDATYRVHDGDVTFGYNGSVLTDGEFVREIRADTGGTADATPLPQMLKDQTKHHQLTPEKLVYDKAAGSGKTAQEVAQATDGQTQLVAPMRRCADIIRKASDLHHETSPFQMTGEP